MVTSKLFSRLWYKFSLSSPPSDMLTRFANLGWRTIWNNRTALAPSIPIGHRPCLEGGLNFLFPSTQAQALLARWISKFLSQPTIWFHEVFRNDGMPYRQREVDLMRELTGRGTLSKANN